MTKIYKIYKITSEVTGLSYIGYTGKKSIDIRWKNHIMQANWCNLKHQTNSKKIRKFYIVLLEKNVNHNWKIELLEDNILTKEEALKREMYYISLYDTFKNGYNSNSGGCGGYEASSKTKFLMGSSRKGRKEDPLFTEYRISKIRGRKLREEEKEFLRNRPYNPITAQKRSNFMRGRKLNPESIEKIRLKKIGNPTYPSLWEITLPSGEIVKITNICKFCKDNHLSQKKLVNNINGYNGYFCKKLPKTKEDVPLETRKRMSESRKGNSFRSCEYKIIDIEGNQFIIKNLTKWCKENNIKKSNLIFHTKKNQFYNNYKYEKIENKGIPHAL